MAEGVAGKRKAVLQTRERFLAFPLCKCLLFFKPDYRAFSNASPSKVIESLPLSFVRGLSKCMATGSLYWQSDWAFEVARGSRRAVVGVFISCRAMAGGQSTLNAKIEIPEDMETLGT
jgi:hypothetical protein